MTSVSLAVRKECPRDLKGVSKLVEVVNLAVKHHYNSPVLVENRLMPAIEIDNAEAAHPQGN